MSTIAVNAITDANAGNTTSINGVTPNANNVVGKNLIINGAMQIAQRGTSFTGLTDDAYTLDRWQFAIFGSSGHGTYSIFQENSVTPDGFGSSIKIDCTTADTSLASDVAVVLRQRLEGQNLQLFQYATSNAKDVTLSFWVRSNLTGTGVVNLYNVDANKHAGATYTINSSNTWERKTVTIAGDTSSGFDNNNGNSLEVRFYLAAGTDFSSGTQVNTWSARTSTNDATDLTLNIGSSSSNEIYITGVQLEVGETATEFEHRPYGLELSLCQRYYYQINSTNTAREFLGLCFGYDSDDGFGTFYLPVSMRGSISLSANDIALWLGATVDTNTISFVLHRQPHVGSTAIGINIDNTGSPSIGTRDCLGYGFNNTSAGYLKIESEL